MRRTMVTVATALICSVGCDGGPTGDGLDGGGDGGDAVVTEDSSSDTANSPDDTAEADTRDTASGSPDTVADSGRDSGDAEDADTGGNDGEPVQFRLTIEPEDIDDQLSEFPILVHLGADSGKNGADTTRLFDEADGPEDRKKLAFYRGDTDEQLYAEIETWDVERREAWIWVKFPTVSADAETVVRLDYDPGRADNDDYVGDVGSSPATEVWTNGFVGVYHFAEEGDGTNGEYRDSTANRIDGTGGAGSSGAAPGRTQGKIGYAPQFDGEDDFIELPDHDGFSQPTTGALSISFWMARDTLNYPGRDYIRFIGKGIAGQPGENGPNNHEWTFNMYNDNLDPFPSRRQRRSFYMCDYESGQCAGDYAQPEWEPYGPIPYVSEGEWFHYVGQADERYVYAYNNGILGHDPVDYRNYGDNNISPNNENAPVRLGTRDTPESSGILHGKIDEFRVAGTFRSEAWIAANYLNQKDALVTYESVAP